jgi:hypothetical protein
MKRSAPTTALVLFFTAAAGLAEVVVLKGGVIIPLQRPPVRRGNNVLLTRTDGTLLSVPASEIDRTATAAASSAPPPAPPASSIPARPATLAEAARAAREVPKARVRITDANVSHGEAAAASAEETATAQETAAAAGAGRVEVADSSQEKSGEALVVRGTLRNPGGTPAINVRMTVTALDAKGQTIASGEAGVSNSVIDPSGSVNFSVTIPLGNRVVGSLRFAPRWVSPAAPAAPAAPGSEDPANRDRPGASATPAAPAAAAPRSAPPPPAPTPYGRGSLYAPPAPNAPSQAPSDGKTGYLPGPSHPANQPKPPS